MRTKRIAISFLSALILTVVTGGLFANGTQETSKPKLLVSRWAGPHADDLKQVVKDYTAADVTIDDVDYSSLRQKQLTSFEAAQGSGNYDVVWVASQWMKEYVDAGYIMPLDDLIKAKKLDLSIYAKGMLEGAQFYGKTYGLPTFAQTLILAYDSAAFQKAGLAVPKTSADLVAVAKYFKEHDGTGIAIPAKQGSASVNVYSQLLFSNGGYYLDASGKLDLMSPASISAAKTYQQLAKYSVQGSLAWHHDEVAQSVRMKTAPIGIVMSGLANQFADPEKSKVVDTIRYAEFAGDTGKASANNNFWVWTLPKNTNNASAAFDFIAWLTSPATEKKMTLKDQQISAITSLADDPEVLKMAPFLPVTMKELANGRMDPVTKNFQKLREALVVGLSQIASTDVDPASVLQNIQNQLSGVDFTK